MLKKVFTYILLLFSCHIYVQGQQILTLQECIRIALENNLNVKKSELNVESSKINLTQNKAQKYPSFNVGGNYGYNWGRGIDPTTNQFIDQQINFNGLSGSMSLPIISGFSINNQIKSEKLNLEASQYDLEKVKNDIALNTALIYLNIIFNKELLENAKFQLMSSKEQMSRIEMLVEMGSRPLSAKLQLVSQVATDEVNVINAENTLELAFLDLKQVLLLPPVDQIDIVIPSFDLESFELETNTIQGIYEIALKNQPEIKSAELRVKSSKNILNSVKGNLYPSLNLSGGFNTNYSERFSERFVEDGTFSVTGTSLSPYVTSSGEAVFLQNIQPGGNVEKYGIFDQYSDNLSRNLSINLRIPIINGLSTRSQIQQSKLNVQQAEIAEQEQKNQLYQTIESSYRNMVAAQKTFLASKKQVEALEETFRAVENQYNIGSSNFTDYQIARYNLFQAQRDLSRAKYDFIFKQKVLDFYLGRPIIL